MAKTKKVAVLRAIRDHVVFIFKDPLVTAQGVKQFEETTNWGFRLTNNFDHNIKQARFAIVISVGPDVKEPIERGDTILIEPLKWSEGIPFQGNLFWWTKEENILAIEESV